MNCVLRTRSGLARLALLTAGVALAACPDPIELEQDDSTTTSTTTTTTVGTAEGTSAQSNSSGAEEDTTIDPDGGTTGTSSGGDPSTGTTGVGVDDPGCPACIVLATGLEGGRGIAVGPGTVFFTDQVRGTVERIDKGGGGGGVIVEEQDEPYQLTVDDGYVYWSNFVSGGDVMRATVEGGDAMSVASSDYPRTVAVAGGYIYWGTFETDTGAVMRVPVTLDEAPLEVVSVTAGIADLAVVGDRVIFTAHTESTGIGFIEPPPMGSPVGSVLATPPIVGPIDSFELEQLASGLAEPWGIAVQDTTLLWAHGMGEPENDPRQIRSMSVMGGPVQAIASGQLGPWDVAVDDQYVYWTDFTDVKAAPLAGGPEILLAEQQNNARTIVVDDQFVYWITIDRVLQRPKP